MKGCTECCRGPRALKLKKEDWGKYRTYIDGLVNHGDVFLERQDNGDCIYFDGFCMIYPHRPLTCRDLLDNPNTPERIKTAARKLNGDTKCN